MVTKLLRLAWSAGPGGSRLLVVVWWPGLRGGMVSRPPMRTVQRDRLWAMTFKVEPGRVGAEAAGGQVVEPDPVFEVPDGVLAVGVGPMPGVEFDGVAVEVGDKGVVGPVDEQSQLRSGGGLGAPDDQPAGDPGVGVGLERRPVDSGHVGAVVEPVRDRLPRLVGDGRDSGVNVAGTA